MIRLLLQNVVIALVFLIGLRTTTAELRSAWAERRLIVRALLVIELAVPVLALGVVSVLPVSNLAAGVIALMAVCPGAPMVLHQCSGRASVVVTFAAVSLLAPLTVPVWVAVLDRVLPIELAVRPGTLAGIILVKLLAPLLAGVVVAALWPRIAKSLERMARIVFLTGFTIAVALVLYLGVPLLFQVSPWALLAVVAFVLAAAAVGHFAGGSRLEDRKALAAEAVLGNPALALAVAAYSYPGLEMTAVMACYLLVRALMLVLYGLFVDRWYTASRLHRVRG